MYGVHRGQNLIEVVCDFGRGSWHDLHQTSGTDSGDRASSKMAFLTHQAEHQKRIDVVLSAEGHNFLDVRCGVLELS